MMNTIAALRARVAKLEAALSGLVHRLDEIHADSAYKSVWTVKSNPCRAVSRVVLAEMVQQEATIAALRAQVAKLEAALKEIGFHGGPAADFARAALSETVEA